MKILNAKTGQLEQIPLNLGESGRGRWLEEVRLSNRAGCPVTPDNVRYRLIPAGERNHVILCAPHEVREEQRGILLRISTAGAYWGVPCILDT